MANAKYEISLDRGTNWKPITRTDARSRLSKSCYSPTVEFREADKGKVINMGGWGWLRRKPGRWNSGAELDSKTAKLFAKHIIREAALEIRLPVAMRKKDQTAVYKAIEALVKAEVKKEKTSPKVQKYIEKIKEYSPG